MLTLTLADLTGPILGLLMLGGALLLVNNLLDARSALHRKLYGAAAVSFFVYYLIWRWTDTLWFTPFFSFTVLWPLLFAVIETSRWFEQCQTIYTLRQFTDRSPEADRGEARLRAVAPNVPRVDVFIPTYNEPEPVIRRTILGAKALDYPSLRIFVLDDAGARWLEELCAEETVHYIARRGGRDAKAGNLNHGLALTRDRDPAPFILVLDADFVPFRNFLWRTLGLFSDPRVAIVQTPQFYFNPDPIQLNLGTPWSVGDEQRFFFDVLQPAKDASDVAFCCGSCCVWRRAAIESIGGVPTGAAIEDLHLSFRLLADGWVTRWLAEVLANGMSAETVSEFVGQRMRWAVGSAQCLFMPWGPLGRNKLTLAQRLHYLSTVHYWINLIFVPLLVLAPPIYWFTGVPAFFTTLNGWVHYLIPCIMVRASYMSWVSEGTLIPFWKTLQLVYSADTTLSLLNLFTLRRVRAKRATRKGLGASRPAVDRHIVALLCGCLALNVIGLWWGLVSNRSMLLDSEANQLNAIWGVYSIICVAIALLLCIEVPRWREDERFQASEPIEIEGIGPATLLDVSVHGARIRAPDLPDAPRLRWRSLPPIPSRKLRQQGAVASYRFEIDDHTAKLLTAEIYTSGLRAMSARVRPLALLESVVARLLLRSGAGR